MYILLIFITFTVIANLFNVGWNQYVDEEEEAFSLGLGSTQLYLPSLAIVTLPFLSSQNNSKAKILFLLLGFISFILLGISLRRTTLLIIVAGILMYYVFQRNYLQIMKIFLLMLMLLAITFPIYKTPLLQRIEYRQQVFSQEYTFTNELRWKEIGIVWEEIDRSPSMIKILFGTEFLNSPGNYGGGLFGHRGLHGDFIRLLHGSGIIGLLIYLMFYGLLWRKFKSKLKGYNGLYKKEISSLFITFFILSIMISLVGRFEDISFRSYLFLIMGIILGVFKGESDEVKV